MSVLEYLTKNADNKPETQRSNQMDRQNTIANRIYVLKYKMYNVEIYKIYNEALVTFSKDYNPGLVSIYIK